MKLTRSVLVPNIEAPNDELTSYFYFGEDIGIYTPVHAQIQHHVPDPIHPPDDEEPLNVTLASKAPLYNSIEADNVEWINSVSLPSQDLGQAKRKRSDSTDHASSELSKRLRSNTAHCVGASDRTKASAHKEGSKLNRPPPQLVDRKPCMPVNENGIFDLPSDHEEETDLSNQAPKGTKKKGNPGNNRELSTAPVSLNQSGAFNEPEATAILAAPPGPTRRRKGRPPKENLQQQSECKSRNHTIKALAIPQLPVRQLGSRKRQAALHSSVSPHPADQSEVISGPNANQNGAIHRSEPSDDGDATGNEQNASESHVAEPSERARHGTPGISKPAVVQEELGKNSKSSMGSQNSAQPLQKDDDKKGDAAQDSDEQETEWEDAHVSETETDESALELLGQEIAWREVNGARRAIGFSTIKGRETPKKPKLRTKTGREMVDIIKTAARVYESTDRDDSDVHSQQAFKKLSQCIKDLSEDSCSGKKSRVVQIVYAHAIPSFVILMNKAFRVRSSQLKQRNDTSTLEEMIELLAALIILCKKARDWSEQPLTMRPIKDSTIKILKRIGDMHKAFGKELKDRKRLQRMRANRADIPPEMDEASIQRAWEEKKREDWAILQHIVDDCNWGSRTQWGRKPARTGEPNTQHVSAEPANLPIQPPPSQLADTMHEAMEGWSKEEKKALLHELVGRKEYWNLTGKTSGHSDIASADKSAADEMFLKALNAPLLQNRLPEHIRQGALYYKAAIEKDVEKHRLPKWVSSIR